MTTSELETDYVLLQKDGEEETTEAEEDHDRPSFDTKIVPPQEQLPSQDDHHLPPQRQTNRVVSLQRHDVGFRFGSEFHAESHLALGGFELFPLEMASPTGAMLAHYASIFISTAG